MLSNGHWADFSWGLRFLLFCLGKGRNDSQQTSAPSSKITFKNAFENQTCFIYSYRYKTWLQRKISKAANCFSTLENVTFSVIKKLLSCFRQQSMLSKPVGIFKKYIVSFLLFPFSLFFLWLFLLSLLIVFTLTITWISLPTVYSKIMVLKGRISVPCIKMEKLHKIYSMIEINYVFEIFLLIRNALTTLLGGIWRDFFEVLTSLYQAARWREVCAYWFVHL